jgi:N-acetyl-anhydromuramyl-L-alanine amidase AmpD
MIVIHGDGGRTEAGTISWIESPQSNVSYHYLVGRDGTVYQFVDESERAWHSGISEWDGYSGCNDISIGVSFANSGKGDEPYTDLQYERGAQLVAEICRRHKIPAHMIRGHFEVSPGRKTDPWSWFDWARFYSLFGMHSGGRIKEHE